MQSTEIQGSNILILGMGREGRSVEKWLNIQYPGLRIEKRDQNDDKPYLTDLSRFTTIVRSPGVPPYLSELVAYKHQGGHITSSTNIFLSIAKGTVIGVTGTKGKSTTASLIAHILASRFPDVRLVGNIGNPMLNNLEKSSSETMYVAELSSHQLVDVRKSPHVAVLLGIVPEHMDYYPTIADYVNAKANILAYQQKGDLLIFNPQAPGLKEITDKAQAIKRLYGSEKNSVFTAYIHEGALYLHTEDKTELIIHTSEIPLHGNVENILAAIVVADRFGLTPSQIHHSIRSFTPLPHRLEDVGIYRGIHFYNDSLATIPEATLHALRTLGSHVETLILGGLDRKLDFTGFGTELAKFRIKNIIIFPETGQKIWDAIPNTAKTRIRKFEVGTMEEAVRLSYEHTGKGKICLLSPASASFNIFRDYADRGDQFKKWVRKLG